MGLEPGITKEKGGKRNRLQELHTHHEKKQKKLERILQDRDDEEKAQTFLMTQLAGHRTKTEQDGHMLSLHGGTTKTSKPKKQNGEEFNFAPGLRKKAKEEEVDPDPHLRLAVWHETKQKKIKDRKDGLVEVEVKYMQDNTIHKSVDRDAGLAKTEKLNALHA